ncbi:hypothetical protein I5M32_02535 [Pedobacter sp. SD-b]|uniref:CcmD family protein n=1 Tax=Pedobacter segetis TaxID=2793069 RepID=A0ABS1BG40_9SPHI|nr:hypothetical protein [Pedobacter segetis]MBK0381826.1 hypothetical protein [Pedobacter segetis]
MKKSVKPMIFKFSLTAFALILMQSLSFASEKQPDVYISRSPVSDLSGPELLHTVWFWVLIIVVIAVFAISLFAAELYKKNGEPHIL